MNNNILRISYLFAIIAGGIIGFAPAPWRLSGLLFALAAFFLPLFSFIMKTGRRQSSPVTVERSPSMA
jgi:hypothetical protein